MLGKRALTKIALIALPSLIALIAAGLIFTYLVLLPNLVKSEFIYGHAKNIIKKTLNMDLVVVKPSLKTSLKSRIDFNVDTFSLEKEGKTLLNLENFSTSVSFNKIFKKEIKLNKLTAKNLTIDADKLIEALPAIETTQKEQKPIDWKLDFYNAQLELDDFYLSYSNPDKTKLELYLKDVFLEYENEYKNVGFNAEAYISRNGKIYADIVSSSVDEIKIYDDRLTVENLNTLVNNSKLSLNSKIDRSGIFLNAKSDKFYLSDVFDIVNSNFLIPNGEEMLKVLNSPKGNVSFDVNLNNADMQGYVLVNNTGACLKDLSNIPLNINNGKVLIYKDQIVFSDFSGYWGKNKKNGVKIYGGIKDYYKTFDSDITIDTVIANEFFKDYLAPLIANTVLYVSKPSGTRIIYKAKNNIMDITWLAKISKGVDFGVASDTGASALSSYDRAVKGDFRINGNDLEIKNINYYIASDIKKGSNVKPIIVVDGKMDLTGKIDNIGFMFAREMPCEFLNIFVHQQLFKKGTIKGKLHVAFRNNIPYLLSDMEIKNTFIPSQRIALKDAVLKSGGADINIDMKGRFKRANYEFRGKIKNELQPPFVIRNLTLKLDNIDVERFLTALNTTNTEPVAKVDNEDDIQDDDFMFDTNLIRIEDADFIVEKGNYKDLKFGNINANMTLDEKGQLNIQSNKFDIAEGISTLKVNCDLKNLKYYIRLGVKDVNSDLMAKVLLNLDKEISGKASGLIELNGDESMKLNGDIKFLVNEGTIGKIGLVEYVLKIASVFRNPIVMVSPATIMDIVSIPEGKFDKITGELKIKDNVVQSMNIKSYSSTLSALIRGRFDMERHDTSLRIYTRFSQDKKSVFGFLRNMSLNSLANKVQMNSRNDANYYASELVDLPQIDVEEEKSQVFLTQVEGDVETGNFLSSLKKIK